MRGRKQNQETREAILRGAAEVFAEKPFHAVLTDEISARAGVGKGTLYRYFRSKEELYVATIMNGLVHMHEAVAAATESDIPLDEMVEAMSRTLLEYFWERRDFFVLLHRHEPNLDPSERAAWQRRREEYVASVSHAVERALAQSGIDDVDADLAVEMLFGMIRAVCLYRDDQHDAATLARMIARVFTSGVLQPRPRARRARTAARSELRPEAI